MGRRSGNPEGSRPGLGQHDSGHVGQFTADFGDQCFARRGMRLAILNGLGRERFDSGSGGFDQLARAAFEQDAAGFAGHIPLRGNRFVVGGVGRGSSTERSNQPKGVTDTGEASDGLGVGRGTRLRIGKQVKHCPEVSGDG